MKIDKAFDHDQHHRTGARSPTFSSIPRRRLFAGKLAGKPTKSPAEVVREFGAVQSQDFGGALWAVAMRTGLRREKDLEQLFNKGALVRTHVMRPTWHFVHPRDLRWLLTLTAPRVHAGSAGRYRQLGLDARTLARAAKLMTGEISGGNFMTRPELGEVLRRNRIDTSGQRLAYMVMYAELEQAICSGPRRGKALTYAAFDERVPAARAKSRDSAVAELALRYFSSHGPATFKDFAWWSRLTVADGRAGAEEAGDRLITADIDGRAYVFAADAPDGRLRAPVVHLLPNFDETVASFVDYSPAFAKERLGRIAGDQDVLARHLVALDGRIVGGWKRTLRADRVDIEVRLLSRFDPAQQRALNRAAGDYARFLERDLGDLRLELIRA